MRRGAGRLRATIWGGWVLAVMPLTSGAALLGPVEANGSLGYTYRALSEEAGDETVSHQLSGSVNLSSYFMEPWLATTDLALTFTTDSTEFSQDGGTATTDSDILTGDFGLNLFPQSRTPFTLRYQATDSRVDQSGVGDTPITFVGQEYSTTLLALRQAWLTDNGGRYQLRYEIRGWESDQIGEYDNQVIGAEADLRGEQHHLMARLNQETTKHSLIERKNDNLIVDVSHFYFPARHFRVDSKASLYSYERSYWDPAMSDTRLATTDIMQLSSFFFWRPPLDERLTLNGGVRYLDMAGDQASADSRSQSQLALSSGLFYQASKNLRLDASVSYTGRDLDGASDNSHRERLGAQYESDWKQPRGFMYQYYVTGSAENQADADVSTQIWSLGIGHNASRSWFPAEQTDRTSLRLSLGQAVNNVQDTNAGETMTRLDLITATLAFNQEAWGGTTLAQLTFSDSRDLGDSDAERQLVYVQFGRDQPLSRRTSLTGDLTTQYVRTYDPVRDVTVETTSTNGRVRFEHQHMLGVPRLRFMSELLVSNTVTEGAINRTDWENGLYYGVGLLDASVSYRLTEADSGNYDLLYFRVIRRF